MSALHVSECTSAKVLVLSMVTEPENVPKRTVSHLHERKCAHFPPLGLTF